MNDWRRSVAEYQNGVQSIAQSNLQQSESLLQGKASLLSGQTATQIGMAQGKFADKLSAEAKKFSGDLGFDLSAGATFPTIMRGAAGLAKMRASALTSKWKTTQAQRFNEQEQQRGAAADDAEPVESGPGEPETVFQGRAAVPEGSSNVRATALRGDDGQAIPDDDYVGNPSSTKLATGGDDDPIGNPDIDTAGATFEDAGATPFTDALPEYARGVGRVGAALRGYARGGFGGSATSDRVGDAINQARGNPPEPEAPSGRPKFTTAEDDEFGDQPFGEEFGLRGDVRPIGQTEIGGRGPAAANIDEPTPLPETAPATDGTAAPELPKITVQDMDPDIQPDALRSAQTAATTAEESAEGAVEDLAPEISAASSAWSAVGGFLGDAIPVVGFGLGLYGLITGAEDISKSIKEEGADPYTAVRGKIQAAQNQITGLEANVSSDEFASKIGARAPQFGSIAAAPNMDTAKMQGVALHV